MNLFFLMNHFELVSKSKLNSSMMFTLCLSVLKCVYVCIVALMAGWVSVFTKAQCSSFFFFFFNKREVRGLKRVQEAEGLSWPSAGSRADAGCVAGLSSRCSIRRERRALISLASSLVSVSMLWENSTDPCLWSHLFTPISQVKWITLMI